MAAIVYGRRARACAIFLVLVGIAAVTCGLPTAPSVAAAAADSGIEAGHPTEAVAFQLNAKHDGSTFDPLLTTAPILRWGADLGGPIKYPLIAENKVFVDVGNVVGDTTYVIGTSVSAYDLQTGALVWGPKDIGGDDRFGALAYDAGRVFALNGNGVLYAFDSESGGEYWSEQLPGQYSFSAPPTAHHGHVYVGGSGSGGTLYSVDEGTGSVRWTVPVLNGDVSAPAVNRKGIFVSYACKQAFSFKASGAQRWHHDTSCEGGGGRTGVLHAGSVYIRDPGEPSALLSQKSGNQRGTFTSDLTPAFDEDTMVTVTAGIVQATDLNTNEVRWTNSAAPYVTAPIIVNGFVIEGDSLGVVRILRPSDGAAVWFGDSGAPIDGSEDDVFNGVTGLAEAAGHLVVPAGSRLAVFAAE